MFIDTHCHLNYKEFDFVPVTNEYSISGLVDDCKQNNVSVLNINIRPSDWDLVSTDFFDKDTVRNIAGLHPDEITAEEILELPKIEQLVLSGQLVGIGETGLDYYRGKENREFQIESFKNHIELANKYELPVTMHLRDVKNSTEASSDALDIIREYKPKKIVWHCFTSSLPEALEFLEIDPKYIISFSGILTFKNAISLHEVAKTLPIDRIVFETDSPFLAPEPYRGQICKPSYVKHVYDFYANLTGRNMVEVEKIIEENVKRVWGV